MRLANWPVALVSSALMSRASSDTTYTSNATELDPAAYRVPSGLTLEQVNVFVRHGA